jgi:hypothetical protein
MIQIQESLSWELQPEQPHIPIYREGELVGYCHPDYAQEIVEAMNEQDKLRKALRIACLDILRAKGGNPAKAEELMEKYLVKTERPKFGPRAIAVMLVDRQKELQLSPQEFLKFCDTYKLSTQHIKDLAAAKAVDPSLINPLARILGVSAMEIKKVLNGSGD